MERDSLTQQCPYCGEAVEVEVDTHGPSHEQYTEDCPVCCRPWDVRVSRGGGEGEDEDEDEGAGDESGGISIELRRDDD